MAGSSHAPDGHQLQLQLRLQLLTGYIISWAQFCPPAKNFLRESNDDNIFHDRRPVFGHSVNLIVAIVASVFSGFVIYANKLMPTTLINKLEFDSIKQQLSYSYFATYQHMGPYCLGLLTGYMLYKRPQVKLPKHLTWLLWLLLPPLSFTTLLLTYLWNGAYEDPSLINPSPLVSAFYVAIHRTIWTSLVAWIVFACASGRAKLLSSFLSHSVFIPLSRLSFSIYLVHLPVIMFRALNLRHTVEWTDSNILWEACGNFIFSVIAGYFLNIAFESPIINLERVAFGRHGNEQQVADRLRQGAPGSVATVATYKSNLRHEMANGLVAPCSQSKGNLDRGGHQHVGTLTTSSIVDSSHENSSVVDNISDDNKSRSSSSSTSHQPESSPEQERKLSDSGVNRTIESPELHEKQQKQQVHATQYQRKSLRPKQGSVDTIFGGPQQVEPLRSSSSTRHQSSRQSDAGSFTERQIPFSRRYLRQQQQHLHQQQHQSSPEDRQYQHDDLDSEALYALGSEYRHYARGGYQQWRMSARPMEYATVSRSGGMQADARDPDLRRSSYLAASNSQYPLKASSERALNRRPGRYNTLSGIGSRDWVPRSQIDHSGGSDLGATTGGGWHLRHSGLMAADSLPAESLDSSVTSSSWLAGSTGGVMIPRIDSSTLRRHPKRPSEATDARIVEEPAFEDQDGDRDSQETHERSDL